MLYYRAKREAYDYFSGYGVVENELLTKRERETRVRYLKDCVFDIVRIPRTKTYKFFGIRFQTKGD